MGVLTRAYDLADVQAVAVPSLTEADGTVVYAFTKLLQEPGEKSVTSPFIWAHGSGSLGYHGSKAGALELNLETCEASSIKTETVSASLIKIHGGLFLVAFSVCMPAALVAARGILAKGDVSAACAVAKQRRTDPAAVLPAKVRAAVEAWLATVSGG